MTYPGE